MSLLSNRRFYLTVLLAAATALFLAGSASAYIVVLKDGSQITTQEAPEVKGDRVILILPSGTQAFYQAAQIDFPKTEELNKTAYGTARLIDDGGRTARVGKTESLDEDKQTLGDLLAQRSLALPEPKRRRPATPAPGSSVDSVPTTSAGFVDLMEMPRETHPNTEMTSELMRYLKGQGIEDVRVYEGSEANRALVQIVAASEASVFKAMKDAANGLVQIKERFPQVGAFELLLVNGDQVRAGQFLLTPELANLLVTGTLDAPGFFLRYVEF